MKSLTSFGSVIQEIKKIINQARQNSFQAINQEMLKAYFEIGRKIVEEEQKGEPRGKYGQGLLDSISQELTLEFSRGFSVTNIKNMRLFYNIYGKENRQSVTGEFKFALTWTHYCELIKIEDVLKRKYFENYAAQERLSVRDLKRQIYSLHYKRLALSKNKKALLSHEKFLPVKVEEVIKDSYILEFLNLEEKAEYNEQEGKEKAEYGSELLEKLSKDLHQRYGKGFSRRNLLDMRRFYLTYRKWQTVSAELGWSHYIELLSVESALVGN